MRIVRFRPGHLALLAFQAIWLNVILPGHTRGVVALPGCAACSATESSTEPSPCCAAAAAHQGHGEKQPKPADPAARCALCAFAARLTLPPVIDLTPPALGFLERLTLSPPIVPSSVDVIATYDGRAPPAFA